MQHGARQVGAYHLHTHLEQGTIADTYLATHISTHKSVIVKVFQASISAEQRAQCMTSVHACAHLDHPDILRPVDLGEESKGNGDTSSSTLFLVIAAPGATLRQRHPQGLLLPLDTIALYVDQIANILQFAHDQHILHLDLRPEQLFIGPHGRIMLDFTSRLLYSVGPTFISPNALYTPHEIPSPATDQYALAMIICEWLNGTQSLHDPASQAISVQPILSVPGEYATAIWSRVEPVLSRAMATEPAQRYEHVQAFADALLLALNVGPKATQWWQEVRRQISQGGNSSFTMGASISTTIGYPYTAANWHNPFSSGLTYSLHSINILAFSPDSKHLAFNSREPAIFIADITEPDTLFTYRGHTDPVGAIAWSPDGQAIASASANETTGTLQLWEPTTGKLISTYNVPLHLQDLQWSPDGKFIAIAGYDGTIEIKQPFTGATQLTYSSHTPHWQSVIAWSPDSTRIASVGGEGIHVWEAATGVLICIYRGHLGTVKAVAWSPDGTMLVSAGQDKTIQIWNAVNRAPIFLHQASAVITAIGWSPDGEYIITGTDDYTGQVHKVQDGAAIFSYRAHLMHAEHMGKTAWSPDLNILAIGGDDRRVEIANRTNGELLLCRAPAAPIEKIGQGSVPQNERMITNNSTSIPSGQTTTTTTTTTTIAPGQPPIVRTTTRGRRTVRAWDDKNGMETVTYYGHKSAVKPLAWSPDSSRIASGGYDGNVHVWDAVTSTTAYIYRGHLDPVVAVAWSPDGTRLATGSLDQTAKIWDVLTGQEILTYRGHNNFVSSLAWAPDSTRIVSGSADGTAQVWDAKSGTTLLAYNRHTAAINSVDWSVDGQRIASGSEDQTVHIWEAATGSTVFVYRNHTAAVLSVAWSPAGNRIASSNAYVWRSQQEHRQGLAERDSRLHLWTTTAEQPATLYIEDEHPQRYYNMDSITWSPDGQMLATQGMPYIRIYDAITGDAMAILMHQTQHRQQVDTLLKLAWSPAGASIAGSMSNGRIQVWPARE